jgi:hypothetical protein
MEREKNVVTAARRPLVPASGRYGGDFDAADGLHRLLSDPRRTRQDVLGALEAASMTAGIGDRASPLVYRAMAELGAPSADEMATLASVMRSVPPPPPEAARQAIFSDHSGRTAAIAMMSGAVTDDYTAGLVARTFRLVPRPVGMDAQARKAFVDRIVEASRAGVDWVDGHLARQVAAIVMSEGWSSSLAVDVVSHVRILPPFLAGVVADKAPLDLARIAFNNELEHSKSAERLVGVLGEASLDTVIQAGVSRFMGSSEIPSSEKIALYEAILAGRLGDEEKSAAARVIASRHLAQSSDEEEFAAVLSRLVDGTDTTSVEELTRNLAMAINEHDVIADALRRHGLTGRANDDFFGFVRAMEDEIGEDVQSVDLAGNDGEFLLSCVAPDGRLLLMKTGGAFEKRLAIVTAAVLIAVGLPVSIALFSTGTTAEDIARNPDAVRRGRQIAASPHPDAKRIVSNAVDKAYGIAREKQRNPPPRPKATPAQSREACEITRQIVDAVVAMERVRGKPFSSKGAGGDMQLMPETWESINRKHFQGRYPFAKYVRHPWINRRFGTIYLREIKDYLDGHRGEWKTDQLPLVFACYFGGIGNVRRANFDPSKLKVHYPLTYDYMVRGSNLVGYDTGSM